MRSAIRAINCHPFSHDMSGRLAGVGIQVTQTSLSKLENRQRYVMDYEAAAIVKVLKVSVAWLFAEA